MKRNCWPSKVNSRARQTYRRQEARAATDLRNMNSGSLLLGCYFDLGLLIECQEEVPILAGDCLNEEG